MNRSTRWRTLVGTAVTASALMACGGGGGAGEAPPPAAVAPPPASPAPDPGTGTLAGRLWHNNYALDYRDGTQLASLSGALPVLASAHKYVRPWPDGSQYASTDWKVSHGYTDLEVVDLASGVTLHSLRADGYLRDVRPSPASKTLVMATLGADSVFPAETIFVDLATTAIVKRFAAHSAVNWLPDGRYMRILDDGTMHVGELTGSEQLAGKLTLPPSHTIGLFWANRQGTRIALRLQHAASPVEEADLWLADMDGSHLERLTRTKMTAFARWSPDGRHIAFDVDTGHVCTGAGCIGQCELWVVPATARDVLALPASGDAERLRVKDSHGNERVLGCDLLAWTD